MWPNLQETADLVTFTEEILNGKLHFLCSASNNFKIWRMWFFLLKFEDFSLNRKFLKSQEKIWSRVISLPFQSDSLSRDMFLALLIYLMLILAYIILYSKICLWGLGDYGNWHYFFSDGDKTSSFCLAGRETYNFHLELLS